MKIGIITLYNNTNNYGGALQAFALTYYLESIGVEGRQISYDKNSYSNDGIEKKFKLNKLLNPIEVYRYINRFIKRKIYANLTKKRRECFNTFLDFIPHTEVFTRENISSVNNYFDVFIAGSDQIWNFNWYDPTFFLDFVKSNKSKISYAASFGKEDFTEKESMLIKKLLESFDNISLRESGNVETIQKLLGKKVYHVVDPTLLLTRNQWDEVLPGNINEKDYIFCYFLGDDKNARKKAFEFSKTKKMKIISIPHADSLLLSDISFKAEKKYDISPLEFIELIKNASYVFTDSFHCCVFSCIYEKELYAFPRKGRKGMENRILSLFKLFDVTNRFIDDENYFNDQSILNKKIEYNFVGYNKVLEFSKEYLNKCLKIDK